MQFYLIFAVQCFLTLADAAPLQTQELTHATSLAKKILSDIPATHRACVKTAGLSLSGEAEHLEYLFSDLGIPVPPLLKSQDLSTEESLERIVSGLELQRELLQDIGQLLSSTEELSLLLADLRDLSAQVQQLSPSTVSQHASLTPLSPRLSGDYQVQVAMHLSLQQLRGFTQDVFRSLRHIAASS